MLIRNRKKYIIKFFLITLVFFFVLQIFTNYTSINSKVFLTDNTNKPLTHGTKKLVKNKVDKITFSNNNLFNISSERINRLFDILTRKENEHNNYFILKKLGLISFNDLISLNGIDLPNNDLNNQIKKNLEILDGKVVITNEFIQYLNELSDRYSYQLPRDNVNQVEFSDHETKPVIVTAANSDYYEPLQATVFYVHKHFPNHKLVIYDLGLEKEMYQTTILNCKCEVRKFDSKSYSNMYSFINSLKIFSWKPIIIQESLNDFDSVLYIDSSIRFKSGHIREIYNVAKETGFLTQFIGLKFICYTNPNMFKWFNEDVSSYEDMDTIEANILFFSKNFLTSLVMKAWVTCALDKDCISPPGSHLSPCCGCHRYDQSAITVIMTFFYGHPKDKNFLPAYSFTKNESFFFEIKRYEGMKYFT